jgi:hypothetical protein
MTRKFKLVSFENENGDFQIMAIETEELKDKKVKPEDFFPREFCIDKHDYGEIEVEGKNVHMLGSSFSVKGD